MQKEGLGKLWGGNVKLEHYPTMWLSHAHELKRTEQLIYMDILRDWDKMQIERTTKNFTPSPITPGKVHYLVIGFAIENLLKCLVLNKHPEIIKEGEIKDKRFKTHDLYSIATTTLGLEISEDEKFMLELGTKSIIWYGRYPIPLKQEDTIAVVETHRTKVHLAFHVLFNRLATITNIRMPHHYKEDIAPDGAKI
jgi:hypothetical protein